jgi:hypothetical protein
LSWIQRSLNTTKQSSGPEKKMLRILTILKSLKPQKTIDLIQKLLEYLIIEKALDTDLILWSKSLVQNLSFKKEVILAFDYTDEAFSGGFQFF